MANVVVGQLNTLISVTERLHLRLCLVYFHSSCTADIVVYCYCASGRLICDGTNTYFD